MKLRNHINNNYIFQNVQLKTPIIFNRKAQPIALQEAGKEVPIGSIGIISGWGLIHVNIFINHCFHVTQNIFFKGK